MSSIFPFTIQKTEVKSEKEELPLLKELAYDFENNRLLRKNGKTYLVEKDEALKIWIYKALRTKRFVYPAYSHAYGNETENVIGEINHPEVVDSEVKRYITEALMVSPYIQELKDFSFEHESSSVHVHFMVISVYGRFDYESEVYNE